MEIIDKRKLELESKKCLASLYLKMSELINKACNLYNMSEKEVSILSGIDKLPFNDKGTNKIDFLLENLVKLLVLNQMAIDLKPKNFDIALSKKDLKRNLLNEFLRKQKEEFENFVEKNDLQDICCLDSNKSNDTITKSNTLNTERTNNIKDNKKLFFNENYDGLSVTNNFDGFDLSEKCTTHPKNISYSYDTSIGDSVFTFDIDGKHFVDKTWKGLIDKIKEYMNN